MHVSTFACTDDAVKQAEGFAIIWRSYSLHVPCVNYHATELCTLLRDQGGVLFLLSSEGRHTQKM